MILRQMLGALVACGLLGGCATKITTAGAKVGIGRAEPLGMTCRDLGQIYGQGGGAEWTSFNDKMRWAQNELRNKAAALGGNFVVTDMGSGNDRGLSISGHALRCSGTPAATATTTPSATPCMAPSASASATPQPSAEQRLRELDDVHQKGLINDAEYEAQRRKIVEGI